MEPDGRTTLEYIIEPALLECGPGCDSPEPSRFPRSNQLSFGTHSASFFTSSIPFHPVNSILLIPEPHLFKFSRNIWSQIDPESFIPLRVSKGRGESHVHSSIELAISLFDRSSRNRGSELGGRTRRGLPWPLPLGPKSR
jgi:hypothetical protein